MSPESKYEYYELVVKRYQKASWQERRRILDEFCHNCQLSRNYASHKLNHPEKFLKKTKRKRGRKSKYNHPDVLKPIKTIWLTANLPCSKNLVTMFEDWLDWYEESFDEIPRDSKEKIQSISAATIDRLFKKIRPHYKQHGLSTTKPGSLLKQHIPIKTQQWDETRPGYIETDSVAHCGESVLGTFVLSLDHVDIATTWTEQRAVFGKGEIGVVSQVKDVEASLPFPLLGFDSDQGTEFINWHLFRHFTDRKHPIDFTRSRAYKKNDNAHVEQKNWTHIRQWLGYTRLDHPEIVPLLNDLYKNEWRLFHNFFIPSVKLMDKKRVGSKTIKIHDKPKTPYKRVLESKYIDPQTKEKLTEIKANLNPFELRKQINRKLKKVFATQKRLDENRKSKSNDK